MLYPRGDVKKKERYALHGIPRGDVKKKEREALHAIPSGDVKKKERVLQINTPTSVSFTKCR
jgi:hypothetical protein